jgi:hypothetical protein
LGVEIRRCKRKKEKEKRGKKETGRFNGNRGKKIKGGKERSLWS